MSYIERKKINPNSTMKTFPLLAVEQFERLILSHNVEFRGGFYMSSTDANNISRETYIPDTREVFCNTCKALAILISGNFNKEAKEKYGEIIEKLEKLEEEFIDLTDADESIVLGEAFYNQDDKIRLEEYNNIKVSYYQEIFKLICSEFKRHRFWAKTSVDD